MIGRLRGKILQKQPPQLLIDVQGVGYEVDAPMSTFYQLPEVGQDVTLHTHLVVREDAHMLYGFASENERSLFKSLIKINGVGAKLALTILSGMDANEFTRCVLDNDAAALVRMPGIGKKTAERLIIELRDRLKDDAPHSSTPMTSASMMTAAASTPVSDAVSALIALGYKPQEASRMVRVLSTDGLGAEEIIRQSLQAAVSKS
ncbi:MAG: Holliday junction branch migration protein RuvA [Gammaproteobacteria bacterium]|nr:Holliday junction branch migration protein RuvA [Gammaproteobacteria bacterium]MDH5736464.1 Holliday junction branch migration protein RuvA [Gammaproteobacteria bacterium]